MKPALQLKLSQHLALTPQLQQSIKLLQLSTIEMQQEIERYLLENPMLERDDDHPESFSGAQQFDSPDNSETRQESSASEDRDSREDRDSEPPASPSEIDDDRWTSDAGTFTGAGRDEDDDSDGHDVHAANVSLREHLGWQLGMTQLSERDRSLIRMYLPDHAAVIGDLVADLIDAINAQAEKAGGAILPGRTHLQHAQPVLLAHHLLARAWPLVRDLERLRDWRGRASASPYGAGALAGSSLGLDPALVARELGLARPSENSIDATASRDVVAEFAFIAAQLGIDFSRFAEEIIIWNTREFGFVHLDEAYSTGL